MAYLELKNISLERDNKQIINSLSISFERDQIYAIVGPNGAGKSSLSYILMGLSSYRDHKGSVILDGKDITKLGVKERADLGVTLGWQDPAKFEGLTVKEYLQVASDYKSPKIISDSLAKVGLDSKEYLERIVNGSLSGGERKRIELASILAMQPKVVILDEPDSGIDIASIDLILDAINTMKKEGITVILITHSPHILDIADHAFLMCHGGIVNEGSVESISEYFNQKCLGCVEKNPEEYKK